MATILFSGGVSFHNAIRLHVDNELSRIKPTLPEGIKIQFVLDEDCDHYFRAQIETKLAGRNIVSVAQNSNIFSAITNATEAVLYRLKEVERTQLSIPVT